MTFDEALQQHKDNLTNNLSDFGEGHRLNRMHKEIDSNASDYEYYFNAGQQSQQAKVEELQKRVDAALELMQKPVIVGEPAKYVCSRFKEIEQALKGEGSTNISTDEKGECRHFSTTMFFNGKAECFHCDAVVNEDREVIGRQSKGLSWTGKEHEK